MDARLLYSVSKKTPISAFRSSKNTHVRTVHCAFLDFARLDLDVFLGQYRRVKLKVTSDTGHLLLELGVPKNSLGYGQAHFLGLDILQNLGPPNPQPASTP